MQPNYRSDETWNLDAAADRLARGPLPPNDADPDWRRLLFEIIIPRAQALEVALRCENLLNLALDLLPLRLATYRSEKGRFISWLETVLRNLARDEQRLRNRFTRLLPGADVDNEKRREREQDRRQAREEQVHRLESALDDLAQTTQGSRQKTDFNAILLMSLRLALVSRLKRSRRALAAWKETRTTRAEEQLPWAPSDRDRTIQAGWPPLGTVWQTVARGLEDTGRNPTDDRVVNFLKGLPGVAGLTAESWRQWRKRMVAWAVRHLGPVLWQSAIEPWLETRSPRRLTAC